MTTRQGSETDRPLTIERNLEKLRQQRERLETEHTHALTSLMAARRDLRGVHALADLVDDAVRWSA